MVLQKLSCAVAVIVELVRRFGLWLMEMTLVDGVEELIRCCRCGLRAVGSICSPLAGHCLG